MVPAQQVHSGTQDPSVSEREAANGKLARELAAESIVLLKNDGILPLDISGPVALLGCGAVQTVKGGTGSGDVNNRSSVSVYQGIRETGVPITSEQWLSDYEAVYTRARLAWRKKVLADAERVENPFDAYAANAFCLPDGRALCRQDIAGADAAIYVISRISGEGRDRRLMQGDYYLSDQEQEDILYLNDAGLPIVLLINTGGPVELEDLLQNAPQVKAILYLSQLGQEGGHAVADILFGRLTPGGKLTSTWARCYGDYPSADSFGYLNGDLERDEYREGIFVGYRYFDTFGPEPLFPFGFGLSYTRFSMELSVLRTDREGISLTVSVTNTGTEFAGREVVQIYITPPRSGIIKEYQRLAGFARTRLLQPAESEAVTIHIPQKQLACFVTERNAWVIEAGVYGIWLGEHSRSRQLSALLEVSEATAIQQTRRIHAEPQEFDEMLSRVSAKKTDWLSPDLRRQLPGDDDISLRRAGAHQLAALVQPGPAGAVAHGSHHGLGGRIHAAFLIPSGGVEVIDAGEDVFQGKQVRHDAVSRIAERQGEVCGGKFSEKGKDKRCQRALFSAGPPAKEQYKFRLRGCFAEKMVQRRQEGEGHQRQHQFVLRWQAPYQNVPNNFEL